MLVNGVGYDSHVFKAGRKLILGGIQIPHEVGLDGHSDADALCHAIIDAILGACGMRDIGCLFPDTDRTLKDADSIELLKKVMQQIHNAQVEYIDSIVITQKPKIADFIPAMKERLAFAIGINQDRINIKGKTNENMGFVGRSEGLAVIATATVERKFNV